MENKVGRKLKPIKIRGKISLETIRKLLDAGYLPIHHV